MHVVDVSILLSLWLFAYFGVIQEPESACKSFDLLDPTSSKVVGSIFLSCAIEVHTLVKM